MSAPDVGGDAPKHDAREGIGGHALRGPALACNPAAALRMPGGRRRIVLFEVGGDVVVQTPSCATTITRMTLDDLPLDLETRKALDAMSRRMRRSPEAIAADAVRDAVRDTEEMLAAIKRADQQIESGETMTLDEWRQHLLRRKSGA